MTKAEAERMKRIMATLKCSEEEALEVMEQDKVIDSGGRTYFDVDPEEEKRRKKMANVDEHKTPKAKVERKRKENPTKASIISEIATFLTENSENACENVEITNKERQIAFQIGENHYEFTLVQKRKPKT